MPATQRGSAYRLGPNRWGLRYYDADGKRQRKSPFPSKSAALARYRDVIEPVLRGEAVPMPDLTLAEFVPLYVERHGATVRPRHGRHAARAAVPPSEAQGRRGLPLRDL